MKGELERIFRGVKIPGTNKDGEEIFSPVKVYIQGVPIERAGDDPEETYPQVEFRMIQGYSGETGNEEEEGKMFFKCLFVYGICDYNRGGDGWKQLFHLYEQVKRRFREHPVFEGFTVEPLDQFEMQSDDTYPFQFMASSILFSAPLIGRTDVEDFI